MADAPERKLAVLLHADVVGSTALVQINETLTHERIQDVFRRFSETIASNGGIAHEIRGDALVAEFAKASDAMTAATTFQETNAVHNESLPDELRPIVRVGIAMGELVVADNTVTGEGIVLAQRLEQLAEPGGVCIHDAAYQTVPKRLPFTYQALGKRELKGFDEPVLAYSVRQEHEASSSEGAPTQLEPVGLTQPDKPSVAVLPFTNMSGDPEQEYFSDGITEDIITELSRFRELFIIARNSTFMFKEKHTDIRQVGEKLGAQYVVEGSVRKAGERVRITAQLVEVETGNHLWAERYDRVLDDIFEIQEVTRSIVAASLRRVQEAVGERASRKPTESMKAYVLMLRGDYTSTDSASMTLGKPVNVSNRRWNSTRCMREPMAISPMFTCRTGFWSRR